jgi:hypothetical protein
MSVVWLSSCSFKICQFMYPVLPSLIEKSAWGIWFTTDTQVDQ